MLSEQQNLILLRMTTGKHGGQGKSIMDIVGQIPEKSKVA